MSAARIDTIRTVSDDFGIWHTTFVDEISQVECLKGISIKSQDCQRHPQLATLIALGLEIFQDRIAFNGNVVYEFNEFRLDDAINAFNEAYPGIYAALNDMLAYIEKLHYWSRKENRPFNLHQYAQAVMNYLGSGDEAQYLELQQLQQRTLAAIYFNNLRAGHDIPRDEIAFVNELSSYRVINNQFHTPAGVISKQVVDIFAKLSFLTL